MGTLAIHGLEFRFEGLGFRVQCLCFRTCLGIRGQVLR